MEAQKVLELLKIQEIRDYTRNARSGGDQPKVQYLLEEEKILKIHGDLITFSQKLIDCKRNECDQLRPQRDDLKRQFNTEVENLDLTNRNSYSTLDPKDFSGKAIEIINAQPGTMLVYPFIVQDRVWLPG